MNTRNKSKSNQLKNENLLEYSNKLERLSKYRKDFFKVFINAIQDDEVKRRIQIWYYKQQDNPDIYRIIKVARQFQKEKDEDDEITLPDFKTEDVSSYFEKEEESESNICLPKIIFLFNL